MDIRDHRRYVEPDLNEIYPGMPEERKAIIWKKVAELAATAQGYSTPEPEPPSDPHIAGIMAKDASQLTASDKDALRRAIAVALAAEGR